MLTQNTRVAVGQFWQLRRLLACFTLRSTGPKRVKPLIIPSRQVVLLRVDKTRSLTVGKTSGACQVAVLQPLRWGGSVDNKHFKPPK